MTGPSRGRGCCTRCNSTPISGYNTSIRPVIRDADGTPIEAPLVTAPNMSRFNDQAEARRKKDLADAAAAVEQKAALTPASLDQRLSAQDRLIRKLDREVKALRKQLQDSSEK